MTLFRRKLEPEIINCQIHKRCRVTRTTSHDMTRARAFSNKNLVLDYVWRNFYLEFSVETSILLNFDPFFILT